MNQPPADPPGSTTPAGHKSPPATPAAATRSHSLAAVPVAERRRRNVGWRSRDVARTAALVMGLYLLLRLIWFAHLLVLTAFLGVLFGLAVTAGVDRLSAVRLGRFRLPRGAAAALIVFGAIGLLVAFGAWTAPTLRTQSRELRTKLPEAVDKFDSWVDAHRGGVIGLMLPDDTTGVAPAPTAAPPATTGGGGTVVPPAAAADRGAVPPATTSAV
ncbi:MAG TPA: hypothetical protein VFJ74_14625, partial [Gemmatimonadaceae bacterium]|nr:hypothetical protein [Gemmatimonadaceae bacterium]